MTGFAGNFLPVLLTRKHTLKKGEISIHACVPVLVSIDHMCAAFCCVATSALCVLLWRECVLVEGHLKVYCAQMLKSAENRKSFAPICGCFRCTFSLHNSRDARRQAAVIGPHFHINSQVTGQQSCHNDGPQPVKVVS